MRIPPRALTTIRPEFREYPRSQLIGVSIDSSRTFHKVLIFDFQFDLIEGPFEIDVLKSGLHQLLESIERAKSSRSAKHVIIGIEGAGNYSLHLSRELALKFEHVYTLNPITVAATRKQHLLHGQKSDVIDVAIMGDLLLHGHGSPVSQPKAVYAALRELTVWRHRQAHYKGKLKQLIVHRMDRVLPGISIGGYKSPRLIKDVTVNLLIKHIVEIGLTPQEILRLSEIKLRRRLWNHLGGGRHPSPAKVQAYLRGMLLPPEAEARVNLAMIKHDFVLLQQVTKQIELVEQQMITLVRRTPGRWLLGQIKGLSEVQVASYIGALGDPNDFKSAKQIFSMAGLCPQLHETGGNQRKRQGITGTGRRLLRTILYQMARTATIHEPVLRIYFHRLRRDKNKRYITAQLACANKLNRILVALMRDKKPFRRKEDHHIDWALKPDLRHGQASVVQPGIGLA